MKMTQRRLLIVSLSLSVIYLLLPILAGAAKHGERTGPAIYPRLYHEFAFHIGYSLAGHGKPRLSFYQSLLFKRPFFYGCRPRLISEPEFEALVRNSIGNGGAERGVMLKEKYQAYKKEWATSRVATGGNASD